MPPEPPSASRESGRSGQMARPGNAHKAQAVRPDKKGRVKTAVETLRSACRIEVNRDSMVWYVHRTSARIMLPDSWHRMIPISRMKGF